MTDQTKLATLADSSTADQVRTAGAFARGGAIRRKNLKVKRFLKGGVVPGGSAPDEEGDDEPPVISDEDIAKYGYTVGEDQPTVISDKDIAKYGYTTGPDYSVAGEAAKTAAKAVLPGLGALPGMAAGAYAGAAAAPFLGPAAPAGPIVGAVIGGIGSSYIGQTVQDWFLNKLGINRDPEKEAAFEEEHPNIAAGANIAGSLAGLSPGRGVVTLGQRALMGAGQGGIEAASELYQKGEANPDTVAMAVAAGGLFPGLNRAGRPLWKAGEQFARGVAGHGPVGTPTAPAAEAPPGRPDMKALPSPADFTTTPEGETTAYAGSNNQVFGEAAAPRPGGEQENTRPIYETPGTSPPENVASAADKAPVEKTPEFIAQSKQEAAPARNTFGTLGTAHEQAPPQKTPDTVGSNPDHPLSVGSDRDYRATTDSNVHPTSSGSGEPPTAEILDPTNHNITQDEQAALVGHPNQANEESLQHNGPVGGALNELLKTPPQQTKGGRIQFASSGAARKRPVSEPEKVVSHAVEVGGKLYKADTHLEAYNNALRENGGVDPGGSKRNLFVTNKGRPISGKEAIELSRKELGIEQPSQAELRKQYGEQTKKYGPVTADDLVNENKTGPLHREVPNFPKTQEAYQQGHKDYAAGNRSRTYKSQDEQASWDRGTNDAMTASRKKPADTGIQEAAVTDTVKKLRDIGLDQVADHVEQNPQLAAQARADLESPEGLRKIDEDRRAQKEARAQEANRIMQEGVAKRAQEPKYTTMAERETPEAQVRAEKRETGVQGAKLGEGEETVVTAEQSVARIKERAAAAAQSALEKFPPPNNRLPAPGKETDTFAKRLRDAQEHAKQQNIGITDPVAMENAKRDFDNAKTPEEKEAAYKRMEQATGPVDALAGKPRKRTAAQDWLKAARDLAGTHENPKLPLPSRLQEFIKKEQLVQGGVKGKELRGFDKVEADIRNKRQSEDPIDRQVNDWLETLPEGERAEWDNQLKESGAGDYETGPPVTGNPQEDLWNKTTAELRDMFRDEKGAFRPDKFLQSLRGYFGPKKRLYAETYNARASEGEKEAMARSIDDGFNRQRKQSELQHQEAIDKSAAMSDTTKKFGEDMYITGEKGDLSRLPADVKDAYEKELSPIAHDNDEIYDDIKELAPTLLGPKVANHMQRIPVGYHPDFGGDPLTSTSAARKFKLTDFTTKQREFMAIEDAKGNRKIVSNTEEGYTEWNNHVPVSRKNANFEDKAGTTFLDHNGNQQTVKDALTPEIETHANFKDGKLARYVKNAPLSLLVTNTALRDIRSNLQYLKSLQADPRWKDVATKSKEIGEKNGWEKTIMPDMKDWYMTEHLRAVFDDFARPGLSNGEAWNKVRELSEKVTQMLFLLPTFHLFNVGGHAFVDRGKDWANPFAYKRLFDTSVKAIQEVANNGPIFKTMKASGAGLMSGGVLSQNHIQQIAANAGATIAVTPARWDPIAKLFNDKNGNPMSSMDLGKALYAGSRKIMWMGNDMFYMQRALERMATGMSLKDAILQTEKHFPNYRVPSFVIAPNAFGRLVSRALRDNTIFAFGPYHYGMWNSYTHIVKDALQGNAEERVDAVGKMMALGVLMFAAYPLVDEMAQLVTGDKHAESRRRGPATLPQKVIDAYYGKADLWNVGPQGSMTISPLVGGGLQQLFNRDYAGRPIVEPGDQTMAMKGPNRLQHLGRTIVQRGRSMANDFIAPYHMASQAIDDKHGLVKGILDQLADIKNPSQKAVAYDQKADIINRQKAMARARKGGQGWEEGLYNKITR